MAELEAEYRQEQDRGLAPLTEDEKATLRHLVGDVRALWTAAEMHREERKRLMRCLIREVVLLKDERPRGHGGVTTIRIGWCSGAWSELQVRRPSAADLALTPHAVLERIRDLAQRHPDDAVAAILNAEGLQTKMGLAWTSLRVGQIRLPHHAQRNRTPRRWPRLGRNRRDARGHQPVGGGHVVPVQLPRRGAVDALWPLVDSADGRGLGSPGWDASGTGARPMATSRGPANVGAEPGGTLSAHPGG